MAKIGIAFPFLSDGRGSVEYSNSVQRSIDDSIKQIIFTKKGDRVHNLEFGCNAWKLLFEADILIIKELVSEYIKESLNKFEKRIEVNEINISKVEETFYVDIIYKIKNTNSELKLITLEMPIGGI